jgi:signal transduction histidine kinase/DNA-binding NarL/FixJ family response regulator
MLCALWWCIPSYLHASDLIVPRYASTGEAAFTIGLLALGVLLGLLAYTIFLAWSTRELMFVYFSIIMLLLTILQTFAAYDQFIFRLTYNRVTVITHLLFITFLLFFEDFFKLEQHDAKLSKFNRMSILVIASYTLFFLFAKALTPESTLFHTGLNFIRELFVFYTNILFLYTIIRAISWMKTEAILVLIAFIPPAALTSINAMNIFPFMQRYEEMVAFLMTYNQPIGLSLQAILFSLAMGNRYNRMKLEQQQTLQERNLLQKADAEKTEFFMNMSHELRTPLTIILGMVQQLRHGKFGDSIHANERTFEIIERNGLRLLKQVNHILRMGKLTQPSDTSPLAVTPLLRSICSEFIFIAKEREITCMLNPDAHSSQYSLSIARDDLETLVMNLLSNALKFTPPGGSVTVSTHLTDDQQLTITVADTGIGIALDEQDQIFTRYYHGSNNVQHSQTGLGLALVKTIMETYGGTVEVASELGHGSIFTLTFPASMVALTADAQDSHTPAAEDTTHLGKVYTSELTTTAEQIQEQPANGNNYTPTILVIDDNDDMGAYLISVMGGLYQVQLAHHGKEALELLSHKPVDLIICDIMMPIMDGHSFIAELHKQHTHHPIPLIFLTARDSLEEKIESLHEGAVHYITKPFSAEMLLATIARTLAHDREMVSSHVQLVRDKITSLFDDLALPSSQNTPTLQTEHLQKLIEGSQLSTREKEILHLIIAGKSDKEIALKLNLSVRTVANHNHRLYQKVGVGSRFELISRIYGTENYPVETF